MTQATQLERLERVRAILKRSVKAKRGIRIGNHRVDISMGIWCHRNACGTEACLLGTCGLDPWFRRRGLKTELDRDGYDETISYRGFGYTAAGMHFFGLTEEEAVQWFHAPGANVALTICDQLITKYRQ